ncbi:DNA replication and repair protein RecN [Sphaerotilus hippei]|uniref:DNA repair protein RecN n=1 Tax=Sphaerotilus hippei TaxID=744406 RepID=A0A318GWR2_9BURK|nr:DNA repair protein RecN [Sphaerotilus hippei]PXW94143.1 DNA replication and repair protein RecN [Sphaerotilus hippei]
MLKRLVLRDFVIVTSLEVDFDAGFAVLTGETGAGKSILIDALQLTLGGRGDAGVVREGCSRADLCAEFEPVTPAVTAWLEAAGCAPESPLLMRRTVDGQGKSRGWINGSPATLAQMKELGELLVDIHGQHAWQSLTRAASVRELLDDFAGIDTNAMAQAWSRWRAARQALDEARAHGADLERERERLGWQIGEIARLAPGEHEWDELNGEHQRLAHAQAILDAAQLALDATSEGEISASALTDRALGALAGVSHYDPQLGEVVEVLQGAQAQLADAAHSLRAALRRTDLEPERLGELDARLSAWMGLARRLRRPPEELPALWQGWRRELQALDAAADLDGLERRAERARLDFETAASAVSHHRHEAAPRLAADVSAAMQTLGMAGGRFDITLEPLPQPQAHGLESAEFLVAGHAGSTPRPIGKVASGGELSRLALAIAVTTSQRQGRQGRGTATLIFDEVDSGIGGTVADTVGQLMRRLGGERQVLAVTHLPQVAACADQHFVVSKQSEAGLTRSDVRPVDDEARVGEIARMLGGQQASSAGIAHAREMLAHAQSHARIGIHPDTSASTHQKSRARR